MKLTVSFRGTAREVELADDMAFSMLQEMIEVETGVTPDFQKLLVAKAGMIKVDSLPNGDQTPLKHVVKDGSKIMVIGTTMEKVQGLREAEIVDAQRREKMNRRLANMAKNGRRPVMTRERTVATTSASSEYTFQRVEPLPFLPHAEEARSILFKIKNDKGVQAIMEKYKWKVGLLTELDPSLNTTHESRKLGQNRNKGQVIEIRIRTDDYQGWCDYKEVIKVVCHELAHNEHSEHDRKFWDLCNKLEKEVKLLDPFGTKGQRIGEEVYDGPGLGEGRAEDFPCDDGGLVGGTHVLGGSGEAATSSSSASREEAADVRDKLREAAEKRRER